MNYQAPAGGVSLCKIRAENYYSREFFEREKDKLWPKVWQVACREEQISEAGSYIVYDIADDTIVVVRGRDDVVRAFHNVCPHRGRQIMEGCGKAANFRCPYHNWTFDLHGKNVVVQDRADWGQSLVDENIDLTPVKTGLWGGFVWINMNLDCEPLEEYLDPIPRYIDPFELQNMRLRWALEVHIPVNWKVGLEAFMEAYHVAATHTQLLEVQGDDYTSSFKRGKHSHFGYWDATSSIGSPSPRLKRTQTGDARATVVRFFEEMEDTFKAIFTDRDYEASKGILNTLPPDVDAMTAFGAAIELGRKAAEAEGCGYPPDLTPEAVFAAGTGWHVFPNCAFLPYFDGAIWYRARPDQDDVGKCVFDFWSLKRYAPGGEPQIEVEVHHEIKGKSFGLIIDQDISNMLMVQRGIKSRAFSYARPNPSQEMEIVTLHETLERYLSENL